MTDLEKIQDQLEKGMSELKELEIEETQLAFDHIEYANILVKKLIIGNVSERACNFYVSGNDTSMSCNNCGEPHFMHGC